MNEKETRREAYLKKFKDPRWQKMRLEVFDRDKFTCQSCYETERTLNVHHLYYEYGKDPWDYPAEALLTLCEVCHTAETEARPEAEKNLLLALKKCGFYAWHLGEIADGLLGGCIEPPVDERVVSAIAYLFQKEEWLYELRERYFADLAIKYSKPNQSETKE